MNTMVSTLNLRDVPEQVRRKILELIQKWGVKFEKEHDILPLFTDVYRALKNKGI
jgi:hypothetical protein